MIFFPDASTPTSQRVEAIRQFYLFITQYLCPKQKLLNLAIKQLIIINILEYEGDYD